MADTLTLPTSGTLPGLTPQSPASPSTGNFDNEKALQTGSVVLPPLSPVVTPTNPTIAPVITRKEADKAVGTMNTGTQGMADAATVQKQILDAQKQVADLSAQRDTQVQQESAQKKTDALNKANLTADPGTHYVYKPDGSMVAIPSQYSDYNTYSELALGNNSGTQSGQNNLNAGSTATGTSTSNTQASITSALSEDRQKIADAYTSFLSGAFPLTAEQQAQVAAMKVQTDAAIAKQEKINAGLSATASAVYNSLGINHTDPLQTSAFLAKTAEEGQAKIDKINADAASALSKYKQDIQKGDYDAATTTYSKLLEIDNQRQATLDKVTKAAQDHADAVAKAAQDQADAAAKVTAELQKNKADALQSATNNNAPAAVKQAIANATDLQGIYDAGASYLSKATGIIGEYNLAKLEGYTGDLRSFENEDANRKARVAAASQQVLDGSGLTVKENSIYTHIMDNLSKSPLIKALDRTVVLQGTIDQIKADPSNAAQQLALAYGYVQALDTYQSAVREGELHNINTIDSKIGQLGNYTQQMINGQQMRPEIAKQVAEAAQTLIDNISKAAKQKQKLFAAEAQQGGARVKQAFDQTMSAIQEIPSVADQHDEATTKVLEWSSKNKGSEIGKAATEWADQLNSDGTVRTSLDVFNYLKARGEIQ